MKIFSVCFGCMPQRYVMGIMGFFGIAMAYILRNCFSMAIIDMVADPRDKMESTTLAAHDYTAADHTAVTSNRSALTTTTTTTTTENPEADGPCPDLQSEHHGKLKTGRGPSYEWTETQQGNLLSMFYLGYIFTHIPGGIGADRLGAKHIFGGGVLISAICSLLSPISAAVNFWAFCLVRVIMGCAQGVLFPAANVLLARWVPPEERGFMGAVVMAATQVGNVACNLCSGLMMAYIEWRAVFYIWGVCGIVWYLVFLASVYSEPASHPFITAQEKEYLDKALDGLTATKDVPRIPVFSIITSLPVWALIICQIGHNYGLFTMQNFFPKYMKTVLKFSAAKNGMVTALPYLAIWITAITSGFLIDWIIKSEYMSRLTTRRVFCLISQVGPGFGCVAAAYIGCHRLPSIIMFTVAMALMGPFWPSMKVNALDLAPNYAGFLMALINGIGSVSGSVCSWVAGFILKEEETVGQWLTVFWIGDAVLCLTGLFYVVFSKADLQKWNSPQQ